MAEPDYPFREARPATLLNIWSKGVAVEGYDPAVFRQDVCGNWMQFDQHGQESDYGWEIDHILPRALGGMTYPANLQPLWWRNNRRKGNTYPWRI
jgi:5-methylcytosine-specific restriction endonuclease McrA